jgi:predicted nuclease with RNAse H fold
MQCTNLAEVLKLTSHVIVGIDLAGKSQNPSGWAIWKNKSVSISLVYTDNEIIDGVAHNKPAIVAIDAPFHIPKQGMLRKADREMMKAGYRVFPPRLPGMQRLTLRAVKLNKSIAKEGCKTIEVHPTSTRKALSMPTKDWGKIQTALLHIGLAGDVRVRTLASHEIDAVTAALTAYLYLKNQTEALGDEEEGFIVIPEKRDWRTIKL